MLLGYRNAYYDSSAQTYSLALQYCKGTVQLGEQARKQASNRMPLKPPCTAVVVRLGGGAGGLGAAPDSPEPKGNALVGAQADGGASQAASWGMHAAGLHSPGIALAAACQIHRSLCTHHHGM